MCVQLKLSNLIKSKEGMPKTLLVFEKIMPTDELTMCTVQSKSVMHGPFWDPYQ